MQPVVREIRKPILKLVQSESAARVKRMFHSNLRLSLTELETELIFESLVLLFQKNIF